MRCAKVIVGDGLDHDYVRPTPSKFVAYVYNELCVAVENKLSVHVYRNATQLLVYMSGRNAMILFAYLITCNCLCVLCSHQVHWM